MNARTIVPALVVALAVATVAVSAAPTQTAAPTSVEQTDVQQTEPSPSWNLITAGGLAKKGGDVTMSFTVENNGNASGGPVTVQITGMPSGMHIVDNQSRTGTYSPDSWSFHWDSIEAGDSVGASVDLSVPRDAQAGEHYVDVTLMQDDEVVEETEVKLNVEDASVPTTEAPTTAPPTTESTTESTTAASTTTKEGSPGFGVVALLSALAMGAMVALNRRTE